MTARARFTVLLLCLCVAVCAAGSKTRSRAEKPDTAAATGAAAKQLSTGTPGGAATTGTPVKQQVAGAPGSAAAIAGSGGGTSLSAASTLMIKACDNYLSVNPSSEKVPDVLSIKGSVYYNNRLFAESRTVYESLVKQFPKSAEALNAIRMIAQSHYEQRQFDQAQLWFAKLRDVVADGTDKTEAAARIAESIFKMAQSYEEQQLFKEAAIQYERVALEYPESQIADAALYNAGLAYEKLAEWSHAVLCFQKMFQKYEKSRLVAKARFRAAKCYEKLLQWDNAGEMYLRVVSSDPRSELAPTAMYNAGFCFENAGKLLEAAMALEKMAHLYPQAEEVADVLFKAGDLYGKLKDWESVSRVNTEFSRRFGSDKDRIVQALCMTGIALYMQDKRPDAIAKLQEAVNVFGQLKDPTNANRYYAANAQYTLGEISHEAMKSVVLVQPEAVYRKALKEKSGLLDKALKQYSLVLNFGVLEWTTRAISQMGQTHEDFGVAVLKQQRPASQSLDKQFALELGIAKALEEYLVGNALHYHEENVKLGIKEKVEDKYVLASRKKLTYLPFMAGRNYLELTTIFADVGTKPGEEGFALIARKLESLQRIAPFQEQAITLFLKALELGVKYQQTDEFYSQSSSLITKTALNVGTTYAEVAAIAREAPVPQTFDPYEKFVYKTKLLGQVEAYENQAFESYLKVLKIAEAYKIDDESVREARQQSAHTLFLRGRCYDLLAIEAFTAPPYPNNIDETEKEEYRAQFEEIGLKLQDQAFGVYRTILDYAAQNYAAGENVTNAYVRLYQYSPEKYGVKKDKMVPRTLTSGAQWKCSRVGADRWYVMDFDDKAWAKAQRAGTASKVTGFPDKTPEPMWLGDGNPAQADSFSPVSKVFFRRQFDLAEPPGAARLFLAAAGSCQVYLNEKPLAADTASSWLAARTWDLTGKIREGKNILCVSVTRSGSGYGFYPFLTADVRAYEFLPQPPGSSEPLDPKTVQDGVYKFEYIKNFSLEKREAM